jgi:hypothetical protein
MKFNTQGLGVFAGFAAVLLMAITARKGGLDVNVAIIGVTAILLIELLVSPAGHSVWSRLFRNRPSS